MFERYTERARRVVFFARYEASQLGCLTIETEHLLLGLLREGKGLTSRIFARSHLSLENIRKEIEGRTVFREKVSTSVEIPFSAEAKRVLGFAAEESDRLLHNYIGTEHLLLGILREERSVAASILMEKGMRLHTVREDVVQLLNERKGEAEGDEADAEQRDSPRPLGSRMLPHYLPSRVVHITYSACSPQEEAWIQHAGQTWRAFGYTLAQIVAYAWATEASLVRIAAPRLDERTRYDSRSSCPTPRARTSFRSSFRKPSTAILRWRSQKTAGRSSSCESTPRNPAEAGHYFCAGSVFTSRTLRLRSGAP